MKHFTIESLKRMPAVFDAHRPAPFPGVWPTRIAWEIRAVEHLNNRPGFHETYLGKPNVEQVIRFLALVQRFSPRRYRVSYAAWEFDLKNFVVCETFDSASGEPPDLKASSKLFTAYHPWQALGYTLHNFQTKNFIKSIGGFRVYSGLPRLKSERVQAHKLWMLNNCGLDLRKASERREDTL